MALRLRRKVMRLDNHSFGRIKSARAASPRVRNRLYLSAVFPSGMFDQPDEYSNSYR
ncbi:MAG TPA: hypothetical protein VK400_17795 [Pyrinomonadaceae bacterium]|nr:hypothetical protein [Pyrinomonadaceae bacterium]